MKRNNPAADQNDVNYVFLRFILDYLPHGLIGLLVAMIFISSMGSIAAAYSSLASTTVVDMYRRVWPNSTHDEVVVSRWSTVGWGIFCVLVALFTNRIGSSLIETVNILGSLFYGVILGIFCVAFYVKSIGGRATFWAAAGSRSRGLCLLLLRPHGLPLVQRGGLFAGGGAGLGLHPISA